MPLEFVRFEGYETADRYPPPYEEETDMEYLERLIKLDEQKGGSRN